MVQLNK